MDVMVIYSSRTGNTKKVATSIFAAIPGESKDMQPIEEYNGKDAETYFIGFWTDQGTCDMRVVDLLSELEGKMWRCLAPAAWAPIRNITKVSNRR